MRRFWRRPSPDPAPGLEMFASRAKARRFISLAREIFAEHGYECSYHDGHLRGAEGWNYGLANVALLAAQTPEAEWVGLLAHHVAGLRNAHSASRERDLDIIGERIYLRLWATEEDAGRPACFEPLAPGLLGLAALDHPEHVETLTGAADIEELGGWAAARGRALDNLAALEGDEIVELGEDESSRIRLSIGGFFNASRVFAMPHLLRRDFLVEDPRHGVLFVVPNRHLVGVHPLTGPGMVAASATLTQVAEREVDMPGRISPHVWYWRDGDVQQVTRPGEQGVIELHVHGPLETAMRELGLIEER